MKETIKKIVGNNSKMKDAIIWLREEIFVLSTLVSPRLNVKLRYYYRYGKWPNLKHPQNFIEKLNWIKLNEIIKEDIYYKCADKYMVREYVEKCGCAEILNDLIAVYERVEDIDWNSLPQSFALKMTDGCGCNIICTDKSKLDVDGSKRMLEEWKNNRQYLRYGELQNKPRYRKIIVENFLGYDKDGELPTDYKYYCFNGKVVAILVIWKRHEESTDKENKIQGVFMTPDWKFLSRRYGTHENEFPERPSMLKEMIEYAEKLSKPFHFVRTDLYQIGEKVVFGELTFTCAGAILTAETPVEVMDMGKLLRIPTDPDYNVTFEDQK